MSLFGYIATSMIVVVAIVVIMFWCKAYPSQVKVEAPTMTYDEFLDRLRQLQIRWKTIKVFGRDSIISDNGRFSPITAVSKDVTGRSLPISDCSSAYKAIGLPYKVAERIALAEAGHTESLELKIVRQDLLLVTGLAVKSLRI